MPTPTAFVRLLPLLPLVLAGCGLRGSGTPATEVRELAPFEQIDLGGAFDLVVHVQPGVTQKLEITADDNILPEVQTRVVGNELDVEFEGDHWVRPKTPIVVEIWVPSLASIDASGAVDIDVEGVFGDKFVLDMSGASDTTVRGTVGRFEVDISGAGDLDARQLVAKQVVLELSGAGEAAVSATDALDVDISGAGSVTYFGDPATLNQDISGAGSIHKGG